MSINLGGAVLPSCFVIHLACTIPNAPQNWTFYCVLLHPFQAHASPLKKPYSRKIIKQRYPVHLQIFLNFFYTKQPPILSS